MTKPYIMIGEWVDAGDSGRTNLLIPAMVGLYLSRPELRLRTTNEWVDGMLRYLTERRRYELVAYDTEDKVVGATSFAVQDDLHVGMTLEVLATFITKEYRGTELVKQFYMMQRAIAKGLDCKTLSITKYLGPYKYSLRYVKVT